MGSGPFQPQSLVGHVIDGRYRLAAHLANGGMGAIFRAEHVYMRKELALKLLRPELSVLPDIAERFRRESEIAAALDHANIVRVTDFGKSTDGWLFLVMELLPGESLFDRMRTGPLPVEEALPILAQICSGLEAAHARGVVHRDLKPENVFLVDGPSPWVKLLDFGIAKITDPLVSSDTAAGVVVGTPEYASPEQATGGVVDGRADVYALGIVAWRMLAGYHPFPTDDSRRLLMMHATRPVPPVADARADLLRWPGVAALVDRACAKDPEQRFRSAGEMREAVEACLPESLRAAAVAPTLSPFPRRSPPPRRPDGAVEAALVVGRATQLAASSSATPVVLAPPRRSRLPVAGIVGAVITVMIASGFTVGAVNRRRDAQRAAEAAAWNATPGGRAANAAAADPTTVAPVPEKPGSAAPSGGPAAAASAPATTASPAAAAAPPATASAPHARLPAGPSAAARARVEEGRRGAAEPAQRPGDAEGTQRPATEQATAASRERESRRRELERLVDAARKATGVARLRALAQLREAGAEGRIPAAEAYGPLLRDEDCDVRRAAARRLGELGDTSALKPLRALATATREVDEGYLIKRRTPECGAAEAADAVSRIERQSARRAAR